VTGLRLNPLLKGDTLSRGLLHSNKRDAQLQRLGAGPEGDDDSREVDGRRHSVVPNDHDWRRDGRGIPRLGEPGARGFGNDVTDLGGAAPSNRVEGLYRLAQIFPINPLAFCST
jgi:hypothetical protein